ncbi:protein-disulfide reductase DsbD domain-containing protein [Ancylobacter radicis]|uniref:Thiol:disulfide interchange protein DsbD N-terminal domain-containing protein n=1 Tax=Ancylobacter radicis TaxID=2836179 RepID=A0ABS5RBY0_9HYPH|nr:protein-disulfide reductase DsbD domain-containing protein [Ancylobacter radicis]MBS9479166.1 hypothetical protein [Ancylobacter radicis]
MVTCFRLSLLSVLAAAVAAVAMAVPARAELASPWSAPSGTAVRIVAASEKGALAGGVEIRLVPGWKTYWRYPGDAGVPPRFDWSGSSNVAHVEMLWPAPVRFDEGGSLSIGYKHDVILPFKVTPRDPGKPVELRLTLDFAVCEKICQPADARVELDVPAEGAGASSPTLRAAFAAVPRETAMGGVTAPAIESALIEGTGDQRSLRILARVSDPASADLFVEGPDEAWALPLPARGLTADGRTVFELPVDGVPSGADIATTPLRFTLTDHAGAVEVLAPLSTP